MGGNQSIIEQKRLDDYLELTYLKKSEILNIHRKFREMNYGIIQNDINFRFNKEIIMEHFPELKYNPFRDRIFHVFSSQNDNKLSFEDFLDLASALSERCPFNVKATWIFKIFDFDDDKQINKNDICEIIDRLTMPSTLFAHEKNHICDTLLETMDLQHNGSMSQLEFLHAMFKMPEFIDIYSFKI